MDYKIKIHNIQSSTIISKIPRDAQSFVCFKIIEKFLKEKNGNQDFIYIAKNDAEISLIENQLKFFLGTEKNIKILTFPAWDINPFDPISPKPTILGSRIKTIHKIATRKEEENFIILTSVNSILQKTIPLNLVKNLGIYLEIGSKTSITQISKFLISQGYERRECANDIGEFAIRGGIVDIVSQEAGDLIGYRIDLFGDEVESIKIFNVITQITEYEVKKIEILPASEILLNENTIANFRSSYRQIFGASVDDQLYQAISDGRTYAGMENFLPFFYKEELVNFIKNLQNPIAFFHEEIVEISQERDEEIAEFYNSRIEQNKLDRKLKDDYIAQNIINKNLLYFNQKELFEVLSENIEIKFSQFESSNNSRNIDLEIKKIPDFSLAGRANKKDPIDLMKEFIASINPVDLKKEKAKKIVISCLSENFKNRISKILLDYNLSCEIIENFSDLQKLSISKIGLNIMPLNFGFYSSDLILIGEQALFGEKLIRKKTSKEASKRILEEGLSINLGELIVHRDHGIGKFDGIHTIEAGGIKSDFLKILYGGNDILFVPVDDINLITRYGEDNSLIQLDRLGISGWKNRRDKVKKRIKVAAEELLKVAAARRLKKSKILIPQSEYYEEFRNNFGFVETDDQMRAIEEVEEDLQKGMPMDRLVCGDVGFGKTEVAMRAAACVAFAQNSKESHKHQIAIITPTTLLCRQHYKNFIERFGKSGVNIVQLSRLISASEAKENKQKIESGEAQIIIGTHALLHKNIKFKNLSLAIIDEEQHFGVAQKERLKELKNDVHILTLSATPIPRTLQMSLTGVKDLSLIATAPIDRLAVRNFVMPYDSGVTREAIMREYNRGGKVFFVVPRISDIKEMEARLKILLPEINITHAHGQMSSLELDQIMNDFVDGKIDVLLSTTIIESGIDISSANTMIIYRAEMFGLAQLYQLRGRVGRGKIRAYCYFMLDNRKKISKESKKKLEVMQNLDSLGVGFSVASHDMDIRGSGNILGDEQSGHIKETGAELYQQMLLETIEKIKNNDLNENNDKTDIFEDFSTQIKLGISLLIPESYIFDLGLRMSFYKKIATVRNEEDQENLVNEMTDRFGKIPEEVFNLIEISKMKYLAKEIGIDKIEAKASGISVSFKNNKFQKPDKLLEMVFSSNNQIKIEQNQKLLFICDTKTPELKILLAFKVIDKIKNLL